MFLIIIRDSCLVDMFKKQVMLSIFELLMSVLITMVLIGNRRVNNNILYNNCKMCEQILVLNFVSFDWLSTVLGSWFGWKKIFYENKKLHSGKS